MERNGVLVQQKYMEYLGSTMGFIVSLYLASIVDGILVSQLISPAAFAAINLTLPVYYARNIVFFLFVDGGAVLAAQFIGARDKVSCARVFTISIAWGAAAMTLLGIIGCLLLSPTASLYGEMDQKGVLQVLKRALRLTFGLCLVIFLLIFIYPAGLLSGHMSGENSYHLLLARRCRAGNWSVLPAIRVQPCAYVGSTSHVCRYGNRLAHLVYAAAGPKDGGGIVSS